MNMFSHLEEAAGKWGDEIAVVHNGRAFQYAELYAAAESIAIILQRVGVGAGDKVGLMFPSSPEAIAASFAVWRLKAVMVSIGAVLKSDEVCRLAENIGVDAFCYSAPYKRVIPDAGGVESVVWEGRTPLRVGLAAARPAAQSERDQLRGIDAAAIYFSSGTTAESKGVVLSHKTLVERARNVAEAPPVDRRDSLLWLQSTATVGARVYLCFMRGAKIVMADLLDAKPLPRLIAEQRVTQVYATPLFYASMIGHEEITAESVAGIKHFINWSTAVPPQTAERFRARFGREIVQAYGLRECGQVFSNLSEELSKRGSVGVPCGKYEIKLESADDSGPDEQTGEILVRGPGMFDAYYRPWRLRRDILDEGWFRTGDLARCDRDGFYWIVGRVKDVINVGGVKVFPSEIEEALATHPAVQEALVYAVPEARFGEVPHAKVKLRAVFACSERELLRYVNDRLSVFKSVRHIEFVDALPKTQTGKIKRH